VIVKLNSLTPGVAKPKFIIFGGVSCDMALMIDSVWAHFLPF
jgi:hypothetical protein